MSSTEGTKPPQGGGELSGLLRHAETLQRDLDRALADLGRESVEAQDPARLVTVRVTGAGTAPEVVVHATSLPVAERRAIEQALGTALRLALERMFELRRQRAAAVTKGLALPRLFL